MQRRAGTSSCGQQGKEYHDDPLDLVKRGSSNLHTNFSVTALCLNNKRSAVYMLVLEWKLQSFVDRTRTCEKCRHWIRMVCPVYPWTWSIEGNVAVNALYYVKKVWLTLLYEAEKEKTLLFFVPLFPWYYTIKSFRLLQLLSLIRTWTMSYTLGSKEQVQLGISIEQSPCDYVTAGGEMVLSRSVRRVFMQRLLH